MTAPGQFRSARILYRNYKGETAWRLVYNPGQPYWGSNQWHPEPQWLIDAYDSGKGGIRSFALKDVLKWGAGDAARPFPDYLLIEGEAGCYNQPIMGETLKLLRVDGEEVGESIRNHFHIGPTVVPEDRTKLRIYIEEYK